MVCVPGWLLDGSGRVRLAGLLPVCDVSWCGALFDGWLLDGWRSPVRATVGCCFPAPMVGGVPGVAVAGALMRGRGGFGVGALYSFLSGFVVLGGVWVG